MAEQLVMRDEAGKKGINVGWTAGEGVSLNNQKVKPESFGLVNTAGRYTGTQEQMNSLFGSITPQQVQQTTNDVIKSPTRPQAFAGQTVQQIPQGTQVQAGFSPPPTAQSYQQTQQETQVQTGFSPPPTIQPQAPATTLNDEATKQGAKVEFDRNNNMTYVNGNPVDPTKFGIVNGSGTPEQIKNLIASVTPNTTISDIDTEAKRQGINIEKTNDEYNRILVNGKLIQPTDYGVKFENGKFSGTQERINNLLKSATSPTPPPIATKASTAPVTLRDTATSKGVQVGWSQAGGVTLNGTSVQPEKFGLVNVNGTYTGTQEQINNLINSVTDANVGLRSMALEKGIKVGLSQAGGVTLDGVQVKPEKFGLVNVNGTYTGTQEQINNLLDSVAPNKAITATQKSDQAFFDSMNKLISKYAETKFIPEHKDTIENLLKTITENKYTNPYKPAIEAITAKISTGDFKYDPATDPAFQAASKEATRQIISAMNERGLGNSTITTDRISQAIAQMIPQYEALAHQRWHEGVTDLINQGNFLSKLDDSAYQQYTDTLNVGLKIANEYQTLDDKAFMQYQDTDTKFYNAVTMNMSLREKQLSAKALEYTKAMDMVDILGYVDNSTSLITGLPVNAPSKEARIAGEKAINDIKVAEIEAKSKAEAVRVAHENAQDDIILSSALQENKVIAEEKRKKEAADIVKAEDEAQKTIESKVRASLAGLTPDEAIQQLQGIDEATGLTNYDLLAENAPNYASSIIKDIQDAKVAFDKAEKEGKLEAEKLTLSKWIANDASNRSWYSEETQRTSVQNANDRGLYSEETQRMNAETQRLKETTEKEKKLPLSIKEYQSAIKDFTESLMVDNSANPSLGKIDDASKKYATGAEFVSKTADFINKLNLPDEINGILKSTTLGRKATDVDIISNYMYFDNKIKELKNSGQAGKQAYDHVKIDPEYDGLNDYYKKILSDAYNN